MSQFLTTNNNTGSQALALHLKPEVEQALSTLTEPQRRLICAALQPPIKAIPQEQSEDTIVEVISATYLRAGQSADPTMLPINAAEFYRRVLQEFPMVTLDEIKAAMEDGVYGRFGEFYGLNTRTFILWVREYLSSQERQRAKEEFQQAQKAKNREIIKPKYWKPEYWTQEQIDIWQAQAEKFYQLYLQGDKLFKIVPTQVYWLLRHKGLIQITQERVQELTKLAQEAHRVSVIENPSKRSTIEIDNLLKSIINLDDQMVKLHIQLEAKRIAVIQFFYECQKQEKKSIF